MRLAPVIACLLIVCAAGCESSHGDRDAGRTNAAAPRVADDATTRDDSNAPAGRTTSTDSESEAESAARTASVDHGEAEGWARKLLLSVDVRDARTGTPVAGVAVGRGHTDARGHHEEHRPMPYPGEQIEVRCPTRIAGMDGHRIGTAPFVVRNGRAEAVIRVIADCAEPAGHRRLRALAGFYVSGFETSAFLPCSGMPVEAAYYDWPHGYWADPSPAVQYALDRTVPSPFDVTARIPFQRGLRKAYVEWLATETGPGLEGGMGNALYALEVHALFRASATPPASCHPVDWDRFPLPPTPNTEERRWLSRLSLRR